MLNRQTNRTIRDTSLLIDGAHFFRCTFINCQLIYSGRDEVDFDDCTFQDCNWTFDDAAARTLGYISTLFQKVEPDGKNLVGELFAGITDTRITRVRDVVGEARFDVESNQTAEGVVTKGAIAS